MRNRISGLLLMLAVAAPVYAQDTTTVAGESVVEVTRTDVDVPVDGLKGEILERVDALAQSLGVATEYLWTVLVKQAYVEAIRDILFFIAVLIGTFIAYRLSTRWSEKYSAMTDGVIFVPIGAMWVGITILMTTTVIGLTKSVAQLANPEGYAVLKVLEFIGGVTQ